MGPTKEVYKFLLRALSYLKLLVDPLEILRMVIPFREVKAMPPPILFFRFATLILYPFWLDPKIRIDAASHPNTNSQ